MSKRKVLFLMTDSQRADMLGCYGNSDMHTPSVPAGQGGYLFRLLSSFLRVMV